MRRAPIVLAGTAAGLAGVLAYHTTGSKNLVLTSAGGPASNAQGSAGNHSSKSEGHRAGGSAATHHRSTTVAAPPQPTGTRTAVGKAVSYPYGDLQLKVTKQGSRITHIAIAHLSVPEQQSAQIDQFAVPQLQSQALSAQSANISGISGASYTSAAYRQSLQSALAKL